MMGIKWVYNLFWVLFDIFISIVYPRKTYGKENIPEGACLLCCNHSSMADPFLLGFAVGRKNQLHFMAKAELFRIPGIGLLMTAGGMFPVDRDGGGAMAVKRSMKLLKAGEKVGIFPEGTRISSDDQSAAKAGAVQIAARTGAPLVPVYIPREKKKFRRVPVVIGTPYTIQVDKKTAKSEDYDRLAAELMENIHRLKAVIG